MPAPTVTGPVVGQTPSRLVEHHGIRYARGSIMVGGLAALGLASFYVVVLAAFGGPDHVVQQLPADAVWVVALTVGFGVQASLMAELRRRNRLGRGAGATAGAGGGASAAGMVACCAHHVADLAPLLGATGVAVFLTAYRTPMMLLAIAMTAIGIGLSLRRLYPRTPVRTAIRKAMS
jgi:hypothetical protein